MSKKAGLKRVGIGLLQHLLAAAAMVAVAGLLLNSYIAVESIDGVRSYKVFSLDMSKEFEESDVYHDLFRNAVSDITQLAIIKDQLETDESFDATKKIDVTKYAAKNVGDNGCTVTAVYELDELIKWGKYGMSYTISTMSMTEFISYFGEVLFPENFTLDEYGQLVFGGFNRIEADFSQKTDSFGTEQEQVVSDAMKKSAEELAMLSEEMNAYTSDQLEDMVFSYIMSKNLDGIELYREEDGRLRISVSVLECRYATTDGAKKLFGYADNWVDYMRLQSNVATAIENLTLNYQRYQICNKAYREDKTNVRYMVRMMTDEGIKTYTNVPDLRELADEAVTEFFFEYDRYLIYYPDSLAFTGNTQLLEEELDKYISMYAYPDTTHIWIGVDTSYLVEGDAFYNASEIYEKIVPNVGSIIIVIAILVLLWLGVAIYLTVTTGEKSNEDGERIVCLNRFDRIWTEVFFLLGAVFVQLGVFGYRVILDVAATAGVVSTEMMGVQLTKLYRYSVFGAFGVCASLMIDLFWYSLVRRVKAGSLWEDSLLNKLCHCLGTAMRFILRHRNSMVSILIPYNLFLFVNLAGIMMAYNLYKREKPEEVMLIACGLVVFDCIVGVVLFKRNAERIEIVDGIAKIRDGEVEYKLEAESLHGTNRELADAVNNIGEGIRKAVKTSMKDEQLKTDLITNVSHDIKTPLTSIISYVDLLKRLKIEEEPARSYIGILDAKAQRLKQLTDDLVEASKISSGNIELNREKLNLTELLNQSIGEFSEKLEERRLQVVFEQAEQTAYIYADSRRMWRVSENLFNNICKYALDGTRVYIDVTVESGKVRATVKNISRQQMNIKPDELTERFIRGDSSRSTEGSGLGLSIAKSLVQAQGGSFEIVLDGDLFKIVLEFPEYSEENR